MCDNHKLAVFFAVSMDADTPQLYGETPELTCHTSNAQKEPHGPAPSRLTKPSQRQKSSDKDQAISSM